MDEDIRQFIEEIRKEFDFKLEKVQSEVDNRVKFSTFTWVLGILMLLVIGIQGVIYAKVEGIDAKASATQNSVARIEGQLVGAEIIK